MESSRRIKSEKVEEILTDFKNMNRETIKKIIHQTLKFQKLVEIGENLLHKRISHFCGDLESDLKIYKENFSFKKPKQFIKM